MLRRWPDAQCRVMTHRARGLQGPSEHRGHTLVSPGIARDARSHSPWLSHPRGFSTSTGTRPTSDAFSSVFDSVDRTSDAFSSVFDSVDRTSGAFSSVSDSVDRRRHRTCLLAVVTFSRPRLICTPARSRCRSQQPCRGPQRRRHGSTGNHGRLVLRRPPGICDRAAPPPGSRTRSGNRAACGRRPADGDPSRPWTSRTGES
jgi:hypothetical protein